MGSRSSSHLAAVATATATLTLLLAPGALAQDPTIVEFPLPSANSGPQEIAAGPDGNLWFTQRRGNRIGAITPDGAINQRALPSANSQQ